MTMNNNFYQFTNRYSLSKTLRFELKPIGKTRENIKAANPDFIHDQNIENAYQMLKPVFDILHEEFISRSLENSEAKKISFTDYFSVYKDLRNEKDKTKKLKLIKRLEDQEKKLRGFFTEIYKTEGENFKNQVGNDKKGKPILKGDSFKVLTEVGILKYLKENSTKNIVVAAPTGVAAINAGGVTLHSLFQLPFHPFLPTKSHKEELLARTRITKQRQQLLRKMELLVIDEISMVRCDVMDAIDTILKHARRNYHLPFAYHLPRNCFALKTQVRSF